MAGARISREKGWSRWRGRVFLEKNAGLDGWAAYGVTRALAPWSVLQSATFGSAYFSRTEDGLDGWGVYFSRQRLVWMAGPCISREHGWSGWLGLVFVGKKPGLDGWAAYFFGKRLAWMAAPRVSLEKGWSGWLGHVFLWKKPGLDGWAAYSPRKELVWMVETRIS